MVVNKVQLLGTVKYLALVEETATNHSTRTADVRIRCKIQGCERSSPLKLTSVLACHYAFGQLQAQPRLPADRRHGANFSLLSMDAGHQHSSTFSVCVDGCIYEDDKGNITQLQVSSVIRRHSNHGDGSRRPILPRLPADWVHPRVDQTVPCIHDLRTCLRVEQRTKPPRIESLAPRKNMGESPR
jgi:hypothetical protein